MMETYRRAFREEAHELLVVLENSLLELDKSPGNGELIDEVFRALHTIKGSSAMVGYDQISTFTHELETVFDLVRSGTIAVTRDLVGMTLRARDNIKAMVDNNGDAEDLAPCEILAAFAERLAESTVATASEQGENSYRIRLRPGAGLFLTGVDPTLLLNELRELGPCRITADTGGVPSLAEIDPEQCYLAWEICLTTSRGLDAVKDVFMFVADDGFVEIEAVIPDGAPAESVVAPQAQGVSQEADIRPDRQLQELISSIRVPAKRLDQLVNLVGELVTIQARLSQTAVGRNDAELLTIAEEVERLSAELRDTTMTMRLLPISGTFSSFKRLVHDLSLELGKEVVLTTDGGETELDKTVLEKLNDPLGHLIRNCMDHGFESPANRLAAGKPQQGTVHLSARHSGDSVIIAISDDGAGLDREAIRARALEKGMLAATAELSDDDIFAQIFAPGFSTARQVTNISGRGVGMDVVRKAVESLRGSISVKSRRGEGTTILLRIPLTLAIIESLLVRVGGDCYVIPLALVEECVELTLDDVARAHGRQLIPVRGQIVPYISLREQFGVAGERPAKQQIVVTDVNGRRAGLVVDYVIGEHQAVIKSLGRMYRDVPGVSGATILGDGSVALVLDIPQLIQAEEVAAAAIS